MTYAIISNMTSAKLSSIRQVSSQAGRDVPLVCMVLRHAFQIRDGVASRSGQGPKETGRYSAACYT
jgi:hypothetical protein